MHGCEMPRRSSPAVECRRPPVRVAILDRNAAAFHMALLGSGEEWIALPSLCG